MKCTLKIQLIFKLKLSNHDCILWARFHTEKNQANFLGEKWKKPQDTKEGFWVKVNLQGENMNVGLKEAFTVKVYLWHESFNIDKKDNDLKLR